MSSKYEEMKRRFQEKQKRKAEKGDGGDMPSIFLNWEDGANPRRFLPRPGFENVEFMLEMVMHFSLGPDADRVVVHDPSRKCYACRKFEQIKKKINAKFKRGSEEGKAAYKEITGEGTLRGKSHYFAIVVDPEDKNNVKVCRFGESVQNGLLTNFFDDVNCGDFVNPKTGRAMIIDKKKTGKLPRDVEYYVRMTGKPTPLLNWPTLQAKTKNLCEIEGLSKVGLREVTLISTGGKELTDEEIKAIVEGTAPAADGSEDDVEAVDEDGIDEVDDVEDVEDIEEVPVKKKPVPPRRK